MASAASDLKEKALKFLDNLIENFGDPHKQFLQFMMKLRYVDVQYLFILIPIKEFLLRFRPSAKYFWKFANILMMTISEGLEVGICNCLLCDHFKKYRI
jgi:hypothetical protein